MRFSKKRVTGEDAYAFVLHEGNSSLVALGSLTQSKKTGNRLTILTAFRDSPEGITNWLEQRIPPCTRVLRKLQLHRVPLGTYPLDQAICLIQT